MASEILCCPECGNVELDSIEEMVVHYGARLRRGADGVEVEYDGSTRDFPDTARPTSRYWCAVCVEEIEEEKLELASVFVRRLRTRGRGRRRSSRAHSTLASG